MLQAVLPRFARINVGALTVTRLYDGAISKQDVRGTFAINASADDVRRLVGQHHIATDQFDFPATATLVEVGDCRILIDAGFGGEASPKAGRLLDALHDVGLAPQDVTHVIISHLHVDHIGGLLSGDGAPVFSKATHFVAEAERAFWAAEKGDFANLPHRVMAALGSSLTAVDLEAQIVAGVRLVDCSGHTPGHVGVMIEDGGDRLFIAGDLANHPVLSMARTDWHMCLDADPAKAAARRHSMLGWAADEAVPFAPYHMPFPAVGRVFREGDGFRYEPAELAPGSTSFDDIAAPSASSSLSD
ncbi:MAG: MBL fold metallo-hydrolase [Pseudomonadota bacterium]